MRAVIELASFAAFSPTHQSLLDQLTESIGLVLNTVAATSVTEKLLEQSQSQAQELQSRQEQLRQSNEDLAEQAALLADKNSEIESKYQEVEEAKRLVEEKARSCRSRRSTSPSSSPTCPTSCGRRSTACWCWPSSSRTTPTGTSPTRQVQYAHVIRTSGVDLLKLLNDILDLAKVESKTVHLEIAELSLAELRDSMLQTFQPIADGQGLAFSVELDERLPPTMATDPHRLRQVLKNLLSNAFKFTEHGEVALRLELSTGGWSPAHEQLARGGLGDRDQRHATPASGSEQEQQRAMFEAFAQADGTTAREYGGTGLGLSISRNLVDLLGGEITLDERARRGQHLHRVPPAGGAGVVRLAARPEAAELIARRQRQHATATSTAAAAIRREGLGRAAERASTTAPAAGATVLIVDDDFRNIFALTALLERGKMNVVAAESGAAALAILDSGPTSTSC